MTTKMTTKKETLPSTENVNWQADTIDTSDILIPRLLLMQGQSPQVGDGKANVGDMIESVNDEILAKGGGKLEFIPLMTKKEWHHYERIEGESKPKWIGREPWCEANRGYMKEDGNKLHQMVLNSFILPTGRLGGLPFLVSFKKSSYNAGKKLSTHFQMARQQNYVPWGWVFELTSYKDSYKDFTYWVWDVKKLREATKEQFDMAAKWRTTLEGNAVDVDGDTEEGQTSSRLSRTVEASSQNETEIPL